MKAKGADGMLFCKLELNLARGNRIREHGYHKIAALQICDGFRCVDDSSITNQNRISPTVAMWKSLQGRRKGGQGVAVRVYAIWKVHKQSSAEWL